MYRKTAKWMMHCRQKEEEKRVCEVTTGSGSYKKEGKLNGHKDG